jgi:hypothetical protein
MASGLYVMTVTGDRDEKDQLGDWNLPRLDRQERNGGLVSQSQRRKRANDSYGFKSDGDDLSDEAEDVLWIVGAIRIVGDAATLVGRDLILIDDPFERGAVAEAVVEGFFRDVGKGKEVVVDQSCFVFAQTHFGYCQFSFSPAFSLFVSGYSGCCS